MNIEKINDCSRVWVFASPEKIEPETGELINRNIKNFLAGWQAHGKDLSAICEFHKGHFFIITIDEEIAQATGCSIDKMMHFMMQIEQEFKLKLTDRSLIYYEKEDQLKSCRFNEIRSMIEKGILEETTNIYDTSIARGEELKQRWPAKAAQTWLSKYFKKTHV